MHSQHKDRDKPLSVQPGGLFTDKVYILLHETLLLRLETRTLLPMAYVYKSASQLRAA